MLLSLFLSATPLLAVCHFRIHNHNNVQHREYYNKIHFVHKGNGEVKLSAALCFLHSYIVVRKATATSATERQRIHVTPLTHSMRGGKGQKSEMEKEKNTLKWNVKEKHNPLHIHSGKKQWRNVSHIIPFCGETKAERECANKKTPSSFGMGEKIGRNEIKTKQNGGTQRRKKRTTANSTHIVCLLAC